MSTVYSASRLDRVFAQAMTSLRVLPNTSHTWTSTGSIIARHQGLTLTQNNPWVERPDKTGTRSAMSGIRGRQSGTFSFTAPLIPSGVAGTAPDLDMILQCAFGAAATGTSTKIYAFNDTGYLPFAFLRYNKSGGSSPTHQLAGGCIVQRLSLALGGEYLMMTVDGKAVYVSDSTQFASYTGNDAVAKFDLTAWPTEPTSGAPVTVAGSPINGFGGTATFDSNPQADLRGSPTLTINTGLDFAEDGYADGYPFAVIGGKRTVTLGSLRFIDNDQAALNNLKVKAFSKAAIDITIAVNNVAGSIVSIALKSLVLAPHQIVENGPAFDINFGDSPAHASTVTSIDDLVLTFS